MNLQGEVLIIDGKSHDKTVDIAFIYGAKLYISKEKNRGLQLNMGAKKATGNWLLFLHADSRLNHKFFTKIKSFIKEDTNSIYFFKFRINNKKAIYRFLEFLVNFRSKFFKNPYGDQGLLIHKKSYIKLKGYKEIPLMEDLDFIKRIHNKKYLKMLNIPIYTSSRKWEKTNFIFQAFKNWRLRQRWLRGESINSIYEDYYKN